MINRASTVNQRIRESEKFPQIRNAELELKENEARLKAKYGTEFVRTGKRAATSKGKIGSNRVKVDDAVTSDFFSTHVLNKDPECAAYMPYNEVHYPNLFSADKMPPEVLQEGMWMSGFIDRAIRGEDLGEKVGKKKRKKKKDEPKFITSSVGSTLKEKSFVDVGSTLSLSAGSGSMTFGGMGTKPVSLDPVDALLEPYDDLDSDPGDNDLSRGSGIRSSITSLLKTKNMKQAVLSMTASVVQSSASGANGSQEQQQQSVATIMKRFKPYLDTMITKKDVQLKVSHKKRAEGRNYTLESAELEQIFEQQRIENEAAKFLQTFWRRFLLIRKWRWIVKCQFCARTIQRMVRGMISRKWIARWYNIRNRVIVCWQAGARRVISRTRTRRQFAVERAMAIRIQKCVRGKLARSRFRWIYRDIAASRIQAAWRGITARCRFDKIWLNRQVLSVQNITRKMIAMRRFKEVKAELDAAVSIIQRQFRAWRACKMLGEALAARELRYRTEVFLMLTNEEDAAQTNLERLVARLIKGGLRRLAEGYIEGMKKDQAAVDVIENDIVIAKREKDNLSPRALLQGWLPELITALATKRKELTQQKLTAVFDSYNEVRKVDDQLDVAIKTIEDAAEVRNRLSLWRDIEYFERRDMVYDKEVTAKKVARQQAISDERCKWAVVFRNPDGKPDKQRKKPGLEKMTYSAGVGVDLLANIDDGRGILKAPPPGSLESIDKTISKVALDTYLDQVSTYEQLLNPLSTIMQRGLGAGGEGMQQTEDLGWGHEGRKLQKALAGVGVGEVEEEDELEGLTYAERMATLGNRLNEPGLGGGQGGGVGGLGGPDGLGGGVGARAASPGVLKHPPYQSMQSTDDHHLHVQFDEEDSDDDLRTDEGFIASTDDVSESVYPHSLRSTGGLTKGRSMVSSSLSGLGGSTRTLRPLKVNEKEQREQRAANRAVRRAARADRYGHGIGTGLRGVDSDDFPDFNGDPVDTYNDPKKTRKHVVCENKLDSPTFSRRFSAMFTVHDEYDEEGKELVGSSSRPGTRERRPPSRSIADVLSDARRMTMQAQEREKERARMARKRERKAGIARSAAIPWALLDELEGEKAKFEHDCAYAELYHKF